ncbi:hypothetical protein LCGC14_0595610 [marine sediment metagenome]|uniref:Uncharacterized protein n=1 Tax=marine sediment metagenome TaxID=412755 RepID=A0A0F9RVV8_9ZZZZ
MKSIDDRLFHKKLLKLEGIQFLDTFKIDLKLYLWNVESIENI